VANQTAHQKLIARWDSLGALALAVSNARGSLIAKSTVQGWWDNGLIPAKHHSAVLYAGKALKPKVKPSDFFETDAADAKE